MTTLAQIRKVAKVSFINLMEDRSFKEHEKSKLFFYRKNENDIYQIIDFELLRGGENLRIGIYCWVPEFHAEYDMQTFPKALYLNNGGHLLRDRVGAGNRFWDVREVESLASSLSDILSEIDRLAIPWFDGIATRHDLIEVLEERVKKRSSFPKKREEILGKVRTV